MLMNLKICSFLEEVLTENISNQELYFKSLEKGYLPKDINPILKKWEKDNRLLVEGDGRKKQSFYLKEKPECLLKITLKNNGKITY